VPLPKRLLRFLTPAESLAEGLRIAGSCETSRRDACPTSAHTFLESALGGHLWQHMPGHGIRYPLFTCVSRACSASNQHRADAAAIRPKTLHFQPACRPRAAFFPLSARL
jgi:hypothetical protein